MLELRGVQLNEDAASFDHVFDAGEICVVLGANLAGKTDLCRLIAGLPTQACVDSVVLDEVDITRHPTRTRPVALVYQAFINYPNFSVFDNIASPLRVARVPAAEVNERVRSIAELLKLTPMLQRMPSELSGGQQQRTALARALVKNAPLVLLDEPLANLDYKLREELRDELPKLFTDTGATVVYATSEPLEALMLGGHTATLHEGRVTQYGPTAQIYRAPNTLVSAQVFSAPPINTATVTKRGERIYLGDEVSWPVTQAMAGFGDGNYTIGLRPHHITPSAGSASSVAVSGTVQVAEISGSESVVHVEVSDNSWVSESHGVHPYEVGDTANLYMNVERCFYFDDNGELLA